MPLGIRTVPSVAKLVCDILPSRILSSAESTFPLQCVIFPPHYNDTQNTSMARRSKGFAFVVFNRVEQVKYLEDLWHWDNLGRSVTSESENADSAQESLRQSSFRTLSKNRWESLKEEYLLQRRDLLLHVARDSQLSHSQPGRFAPRNYDEDVGETPRLSPPPDFPINCLVFVKNVHAGTNKTTLRTLCSHAFRVGSPANHISYVDYNKGMDSVSNEPELENISH